MIDMDIDSVEGRQMLVDLADAALERAEAIAPGGEGLCLPVAAALCHVLKSAALQVQAVAGGYAGDAHWWVQVGPFIVDPTRPQFDSGPLVSDTRTDDVTGYKVESTFPPGWTEEHVLLEAERIFSFTDAGRIFATGLLADLRAVITSAALSA